MLKPILGRKAGVTMVAVVSEKELKDIMAKVGHDKMIVNGQTVGNPLPQSKKSDLVFTEHSIVDKDMNEIIKLFNEINEHQKISLQKAIKIGELLFEVKTRIKHTYFTMWMKENLPFSVRTAQNYMKLFKFKDVLKNESVSFLTDAYAFIKREGTPDEVIDADDSLDTKGKWEILDIGIEEETLPTKKAKGLQETLKISYETINRIRDRKYPFNKGAETFLKIVVSVPYKECQSIDLVGDFVFAASKLLKPGGKLIFHKG